MIKTQAVARLKETARFEKNSKIWVNNFVKELKLVGVRFDKRDTKIDTQNSYLRLGTGYHRNLGTPVGHALQELHPGTFQEHRYKIGGIFPYYVFTLQTSEDTSLPSSVEVNTDFGDIYIQF